MARRLAALFLVSLFIISGCIFQPPSVTLNGTEVRDYRGENLSSVNDFRENSIKGPQYVDESAYRLRITGLVDRPVEYTYRQVIDGHRHYVKPVTLNCVEGWSVDILWEGVLVKDLIDEAGPESRADTVIFKAYDGYSTSFPISYIRDNDILLAYKMNNVTIPPERGYPFMLVSESKWGYKWIKWVTEIELSNDSGYEGYWEQRGYSDSGDLNGTFYK